MVCSRFEMRVFYSDVFVLPLPAQHRFPMTKYRRLMERVSTELAAICRLEVPPSASSEQILRAHDAAYAERVFTGTLAPKEVRRLGFPWSALLVERARSSCGATIAACHAALEEGLAVNLAGGTHHAFAGAGEGYCVFNDGIVGARDVQATGKATRVMIIDCDVHQGNGTASIARGDTTLFTFSIHGEKNFPFRKEAGSLDVPLPDGCRDEQYLDALESGLLTAFGRFSPDLVIYLSGADPFEGDSLGRLALTKDGLEERDLMVLEACHARGLPVAVTMGGGYARDVEDTVDVHFRTVRTAARILALGAARPREVAAA